MCLFFFDSFNYSSRQLLYNVVRATWFLNCRLNQAMLFRLGIWSVLIVYRQVPNLMTKPHASNGCSTVLILITIAFFDPLNGLRIQVWQTNPRSYSQRTYTSKPCANDYIPPQSSTYGIM